MKRGVRIAIAAAAAVLAGQIAYLAVLVARESARDEAQPADVILVLGAAEYRGRPSPVFKARLDHALDLYHRGVVKRIILTGGVGAGDRLSEAAVGKQYLLDRQLSPEVLLLDERSATTWENLQNAADLARANGIDTVVLVSDPFHMFRLRLEARRTALEAYTSPTESSPISEDPVLELRFLLAEGVKVPIAWAKGILAP